MLMHRIPAAALAAVCTVALGLTTASAQLGQRPAKDYIDSMERPGRVVNLKVDEVVATLGLKKGDVVADIGSGAGAFTIPMARAVAPGTVYAVDIDQEMLDYVVAKAKKEGLTNVKAVLGAPTDPQLPEKVDVAFFHRVLHMIELRQAYVNSTATYMKPDGRIVIIDKNPEHADDWMWLKQSDVDTWMAALSFYPAEKFSIYDDRYFVSYQRPYGNSVLLKKDEK